MTSRVEIQGDRVSLFDRDICREMIIQAVNKGFRRQVVMGNKTHYLPESMYPGIRTAGGSDTYGFTGQGL